MKFSPHKYQQNALTWLVRRTLQDGKLGGGLLFDPGLGKTPTTLLYIRLLKMLGIPGKVLIIAPLRVVYSVWPAECKKWDQFHDLRCSIVHGTPTKRMAALSADADIYLVNLEGVPWLLDYYKSKKFPFTTLVVDESSGFKNWSAKRTKALRKLLPAFKRRVILTGTPSPNGVADLFSQVFILDNGEALGKNVTQFRNRYFYRGGFGGYKWTAIEGAADTIQKKIAPLCLRLSEADYLDMPELIVNDVWTDMPKTARKGYKSLEKEMFLELEAADVTLMNAGAKYNACKQYASGAIYGEGEGPRRIVHEVHQAKLDAVRDIVEELQGKPALIAFNYSHERPRLASYFPGCEFIDGSTKPADADDLIKKWNEGKLQYLAVQPKSLSHGINMQSGPGRDVIWLGLTDDLEVYQQLNKRVHRQGVKGDVRIHRVLARKTVDEAVRNRIEAKDSDQAALLKALQDYRENQQI